MVPRYSCTLLALVLCATPPSLSSAKTVAGYRSAALLQREHHRSGRLSLNEKHRSTTTDTAGASGAAAAPAAGCSRRRDIPLWWGSRGGLGRNRAGESGRCSAELSKDGAAAKCGDEASLKAALGLPRGGAGGGFNYDDDYYGGQEGGGAEDPYYEDGAGGWGDEGWGGDDRGGQRGERYDPYEDDNRSPPKRKGTSSRRGEGGVGGFDLTGTITNGNKKYGIYALAGSILLTMMGVSLMFEKNLIRLGNLGFVAGMALFIGPSNVVRYFTQASKLRGSVIFAAGFFFVFTGHPIIGLSIEVFGFLNLFGNMLPMLWAMASNMPFVKDIIGSGSSKRKKARSSKAKRSPRQAPSRHDDYDRPGGYGYDYDDEDWDNAGGGGGGGGGWGGHEE